MLGDLGEFWRFLVGVWFLVWWCLVLAGAAVCEEVRI